ncbi:MAG TPA: MarR family transcriptional regulator, partial [Terrisporobacter glycolicus]
DSGTLTPVVKKLESMDLVRKYRNKEDDRVVTVELTDKGKSMKEEILHVPEEIYALCCGKDLDLSCVKTQIDKMLNMLD